MSEDSEQRVADAWNRACEDIYKEGNEIPAPFLRLGEELAKIFRFSTVGLVPEEQEPIL